MWQTKKVHMNSHWWTCEPPIEAPIPHFKDSPPPSCPSSLDSHPVTPPMVPTPVRQPPAPQKQCPPPPAVPTAPCHSGREHRIPVHPDNIHIWWWLSSDWTSTWYQVQRSQCMSTAPTWPISQHTSIISSSHYWKWEWHQMTMSWGGIWIGHLPPFQGITYGFCRK